MSTPSRSSGPSSFSSKAVRTSRPAAARHANLMTEQNRSIADADVLDPNRRRGTSAVGFVFLLLDDRGDGPAFAVLLDMDDRLINPQFVDRYIARDELIQVVAKADI